jgi:hypothetical protein
MESDTAVQWFKLYPNIELVGVSGEKNEIQIQIMGLKWCETWDFFKVEYKFIHCSFSYIYIYNASRRVIQLTVV